MTSSASTSVLILGGGLAGLSAALELSENGVKATVIESSSRIGGKAVGPPEADGLLKGNVSHLVTGWHVYLRHLLQRIDVADRLVFHAGSAVVGRGGRLSYSTVPKLPGPLARFASHLKRYSGLTFQDRMSANSVALLLAASQGDRLERLDEISLHAWGVGFNTSMRPFLRHILDPYSLHMLTVPGHSISARTAASTLRFRLNHPKPFAASFRSAVDVDLIEPLRKQLEQRGVRILTDTRVTRLVPSRSRIEGVEAGGQHFIGSHVVSALPPAQLLNILPPELLRYQYFRDLSKLRCRPLATAELTFGVPVVETREPLILADSELGLFIRDVTPRDSGYEAGSMLSCVLSRYEAYGRLSDEELLVLIMRDLKAMLPHLRPEWLERHTLKRCDKQPQLLHSTGSWQLRPRARSPFPNLLLAGDWVRTPIDLASLEGAVYSGRAAAAAVLEDHGIVLEDLHEEVDRPLLTALSLAADAGELPRRLVRRAMARTDRRKHVRQELALEGYLEDAESHLGWSPVLIHNISYGGVFFASEASPRVGARVRLQVRTHFGEQLELRGKVVWVEEVLGLNGGSIGVGCKVHPIDEHSYALWDSLAQVD